MANVGGACGDPVRRSQLTANSASTAAFPSPCHNPTCFARVPPGMANQSIHPATAATSPASPPAAIIQYAASATRPLSFTKWITSNTVAVDNNPSG